MTTARQTLYIIRGVSKTLRLTVSDEEDEPVDLTGATVYFRVKEAIGDAATKIAKVSTTPAEITINADQVLNTGVADIYLLPADTSSLNLVPHVYDVWVQLASGKRYAVVKPANLVLERAVTEL